MVEIPPDPANGLRKTSAADTFQVRSAALQRFISKIGELTPAQMEEIAKAAGDVLGCPLSP